MNRVTIDLATLQRVAARLAELPSVAAVDFCGSGLGAELFPERECPWALEYFATVTLHQYGFWLDDGERYQEPYYGLLDNRPRKGAEFMFRAWLRTARSDPGFLTPARQAGLTEDELRGALAEDDGVCRLPMFESHLELARAYGRMLVESGTDMAALVAGANASETPYDTFLAAVTQIPGYAEDPLQKKAGLLAIILKNRPERFLHATDADLRPVVDYHIQRTFLRTGMVTIEDPDLYARVADRRLLYAPEEATIREAVYTAKALLAQQSGRDIAAIDWFFFRLRKTCYEMRAPDCSACPVDGLCGHRTELFQPVRRTTWY